MEISCDSTPRKSRPHATLNTVALVAAGAMLATLFIPRVAEVGSVFFEYIRKMILPYLLGVGIGGVIDHVIPLRYVRYFLARQKKRTIGFALVLGVLMSVCSHGILAISMELYKKGASVPAVMAFLMASPWANFPMTILLITFFGLKGIVFILAAVMVAGVTGLLFQVIEKQGWVAPKYPPDEQLPEVTTVSFWTDIKAARTDTDWSIRGWSAHIRASLSGSWRLMQMTGGWLLIGAVIAAVTRYGVPSQVFHDWLGPSLTGMLATMGLASVIEVCSEGSAPMAFEIYHQTGAFGNVFVFLLAGVATDYTEIGLIWSTIGPRPAIWLPLISVPLILAIGLLFNWFL